jgi:hypothetical protein
MVVVLPAPFGPRKTDDLSGAMLKRMPSTAFRSRADALKRKRARLWANRLRVS